MEDLWQTDGRFGAVFLSGDRLCGQRGAALSLREFRPIARQHGDPLSP